MRDSKAPAPEIDLVDRIFEYLAGAYPALGERLAELKAAVRAEFRGQRAWVSGRSALDRHRQAQQVLALFNGRNAREVARRLGISRATVYRALKQPGGARDRLTSAGIETGRAVRSRRRRSTAAAQDEPAAAAEPLTD